MLKRANKITALVVAAASIMSVIPAMAVEKLGTKDGTVTEGIAFDNGNYAYYGYRTDDDDTGIWYNGGKDKKDKAIEDLEDYELHTSSSKYGEKYAYVTENGNSDEYLVDLSTGKIADEDTPEDQEASAKAKLTSALKKADRYNATTSLESSQVSTERLFQNQFGELWYQYITTGSNATLDSNGAVVTTTGAGAYFGDKAFTGFTNTSGKYIDASYLANLKVYNARKNKATVIEQFNKLYKDEALKVNLKGIKPLAQDKNYIYALAAVDVTYYPVVNGTFDFSDNAATITVPQYFIQKISKERDSSREDGAYIPKSVTSWQLDTGVTGTTIFEEDDDNDVAYEVVADSTSKYAVKDGVLYVTRLNAAGDNVHVYKLKLGKDKRKVVNAKLKDASLTALTGTKYEDVDMSIVTLDEDDDMDIDSEQGFDAVSIDVDGNTWAINDGEISMFDNDKFKVQYKTDRSFNRLDVYNKDSLIAWEDGEDAYTTVQEGKSQTVTDGDDIEPRPTPITVGWKQETTGWTFYDVNGTKAASKWVNDNGTWYYIKADGILATGWYNDNGTWYYLSPVSGGPLGSMYSNRWAQSSDGTWYYLGASGAMVTNQWAQSSSGAWYYLGSSGAMAYNQWIKSPYSGAWYYVGSDGAMVTNTTINGYKLGANGAWI
ncbi:putative endo-beta-N-acetylglucosaminidase precursor [Clostridium puniceum]|uniref:Putative endo-beta-N-acetylglucosaminidase n=1 Tax=Clostridium puniceum TaxID=29367 RepID=A0A1S8TAJ4_9CLOT|nr:hypothetical protein [Clostridium puniceum]OOM74768.1 putative endo-beta-N-acetylglucosaminidase precursor [Clostridium puniceum]